jgi:hypothetical protein
MSKKKLISVITKLKKNTKKLKKLIEYGDIIDFDIDDDVSEEIDKECTKIFKDYNMQEISLLTIELNRRLNARLDLIDISSIDLESSVLERLFIDDLDNVVSFKYFEVIIDSESARRKEQLILKQKRIKHLIEKNYKDFITIIPDKYKGKYVANWLITGDEKDKYYLLNNFFNYLQDNGKIKERLIDRMSYRSNKESSMEMFFQYFGENLSSQEYFWISKSFVELGLEVKWKEDEMEDLFNTSFEDTDPPSESLFKPNCPGCQENPCMCSDPFK